MSVTQKPSHCRVGTKTKSSCSISRKGLSLISRSVSYANVAFISSLIAFSGTIDAWWGEILAVVVVIKRF